MVRSGEEHQSAVTAEERLERDIGLPGATSIGVGTMIAGGIFVLSGGRFRQAPPILSSVVTEIYE